jgi:hypothetical protein
MKFIKSLLFIIVGIIVCYLCWLLFYWLTPIVFRISWFWLIVILAIAGGVLIGLIFTLPVILSALINRLKSGSIIENTVMGLITIFFAVSSCRLAWTYPIVNTTGAIFQNIFVVGVFWGIELSLISRMDDRDSMR